MFSWATKAVDTKAAVKANVVSYSAVIQACVKAGNDGRASVHPSIFMSCPEIPYTLVDE